MGISQSEGQHPQERGSKRETRGKNQGARKQNTSLEPKLKGQDKVGSSSGVEGPQLVYRANSRKATVRSGTRANSRRATVRSGTEPTVEGPQLEAYKNKTTRGSEELLKQIPITILEKITSQISTEYRKIFNSVFKSVTVTK